MSILTKALHKIRKNDDKTDAKRTQVRVPPSTKGYNAVSSFEDDKKNGTICQSDIEVDVRLDQDLSDYAKQSKHSRFKEVELDLNLTNSGAEELSFIESQILRINPTRSF